MGQMSAWFFFLPLQEKKEYAIEKKEETEREVVAVQAESFPDYDEKAEGKEVGVLNSRNYFYFDGLTDHEVRILDLVTQPYVDDCQAAIEQLRK